MRNQIVRAVIFAVIIGGIAHAAHFHKEEPGRYDRAHVDCLLCMYLAGGAGPPDVFIPGVVFPAFFESPSQQTFAPKGVAAAPYEARGPPRV